MGWNTLSIHKFGDGSIISSHFLMGMYLFIHAEIKVKSC